MVAIIVKLKLRAMRFVDCIKYYNYYYLIYYYKYMMQYFINCKHTVCIHRICYFVLYCSVYINRFILPVYNGLSVSLKLPISQLNEDTSY